MESNKVELGQVQEMIKTLDSVRTELEGYIHEKSTGAQKDILSTIRKLNEMYVESKAPTETTTNSN